MLALADHEGQTETEVRSFLIAEFTADKDELAKLEILIAYCSVGDYGRDSSAWYLLRDKETGKLFENSGSHCSCDGFEDQWKPEETTKAYLLSNGFRISIDGYDDDGSENQTAIKDEVFRLFTEPKTKEEDSSTLSEDKPVTSDAVTDSYELRAFDGEIEKLRNLFVATQASYAAIKARNDELEKENQVLTNKYEAIKKLVSSFN
jgi:hypothetical protein